MPRIAVWCDFGGVLTEPVTATLAAFCARIEVPVPVFAGALRSVAGQFGTEDVMEPLDTPLVDEDEYVRRLTAVLRTEFDTTADVSGFGEKWFTNRAANDRLVGYLRDLRARGYFVGMLSNMVPAFDGHWQQVVDPAVFDDLVFSCDVGCRKPDPAMFELAAARAGAAHCVLIDDLPVNCAGARACGWSAVEFTGADNVTENAIRQVEHILRTGAESAVLGSN